MPHVLRVHNPSGKPATKKSKARKKPAAKRVHAQGESMATKKKRKRVKAKRASNPAKKTTTKRRRRTSTKRASNPAPKRRRARRASTRRSNPAPKKRRSSRRRNSGSSGMGFGDVAIAVVVGLAAGVATSVGAHKINPFSRVPQVALAAAGVAGGALLAKKYPAAGLGLAAGAVAGSALMPISGSIVAKLDTPKEERVGAIAANIGSVEQFGGPPSIGALAANIGAIAANIGGFQQFDGPPRVTVGMVTDEQLDELDPAANYTF